VGWQDVEDFGQAKLEYLRHFLLFTSSIPSDKEKLLLKQDITFHFVS
jgi:hypothetical protein